MRVGLTTYQVAHLRTIQLAKKFLKKKYEVTLLAFPFHLKKKKKKKNTYQDRPDQLLNKIWEETTIIKKINLIYMEGWDKKNLEEFNKAEKKYNIKYYIHCTAKIVPGYFLKKRIFLNAHPGILPQNRGVDALKNSIINCWPIGASLHIINEKIDSGKILKRSRISINKKDTLKTICKKNYLKEINLLVNFQKYIKFKKKNWTVSSKYRLSKKRIPRILDSKINSIYMNNKEKLISISKNLLFHKHISDFK